MSTPNQNRRREISEVDPLDATAYRTTTNDDHDFSAVSQLPENLHRTTSITSLTRRRSSVGLQRLKSGKSDTEEQQATTSGANNPNDHAIQEEEEEETDSQKDEPYKTDDTRKQSVATLPFNKSTTANEEQETVNDTDAHNLARTTTTKSVRAKRRHAGYLKVALMFGRVWLMMFLAFIAILSIYWGSWYNRTSHLHNISYLVVSDEYQVGDLPPLFTQTLESIFNSTSAQKYGTFHYKTKQTVESAQKHNRTVYEQVVREVHDQKYWGGIYIPENFTLDYLTALKTPDTTFNTSAIHFVYENGRKPQSVGSYVVTPMLSLEKSFVAYSAQYVMPTLMDELTEDEQLAVVTNATSLLSGPWFTMVDYRPMKDTITFAPIQIGLIYALVMSFHQFNFASALHETIRASVRLREYMVYHIITSHGAYLVLSLVYTLMCAAFEAPYDAAFGKSGFLVCWAVMYLTIAAFGGINEIAALHIFARDRPMIGFWILFFMVINLAPVFSPIAVTNVFYRYGYAIPMYQSHELLKVIFLDTYQGDMGRHIGILIAWIVLANGMLPFTLKSTKKHKLKVEERARLALEKAKQEDSDGKST